jgi:hypothetical protein
MYPIELGWWDMRRLVGRFESAPLLARLRAALPAGVEVGHGFETVGVEPR